MANIIDYVEWRGDLNLNKTEFNEIDSLILNRFSYFPLDNLINKNEMVSIKELSERFKKADKKQMRILWKDDADLFPIMGNSKRFGEMLALEYINKIDPEQEKQFSAITVLMPNDIIYVSYRGTDNTIVGWKEDFNMSFKSHIASQISAKQYLEEIAKELGVDEQVKKDGGWENIPSKTCGNMVTKAIEIANRNTATFASKEVKDRIINVYNNDGPGFCEDVIETAEYQKILSRVHTYIPQSSIIGRLMNHKEKYTIVESVQKGIMQHDLYSWQLLGKEFVTLKKLTNESEFIDKTIKDWLENVEPEKREQVIDAVFEILNTTEAQTMKELKANWFANAKTILGTYKNIDSDTKEMVWQTVNELLKVAKNNIFEELPKIADN